ncbi:hypothetical protein Taro_026133 [Colocasia esculenta]|uniref:Uncharacterized protein n=1 Tax=Colocasia esculenta TaxID=4460 RepID=A0A843VQE5_COLES|nr:hypothetical protein [Colocasia esculenta]
MENLVATGNPQPKNRRNHPTSMKNTKNRNIPMFPLLHTRSSRQEDALTPHSHAKSPSEARNNSPSGQTEDNQLCLASRV